MTLSYCIITPRISNFGGAQLYTLRRLQYLKRKGVRVKVIVFDHHNFLLEDEFKNIPLLIIDNLSKIPFLLTDKKQQNIFHEVKDFIGSNFSKNTVIESHTPILSIWAELISNFIRCKHVIYLLSEPNLSSNLYKSFKPYLNWKLKKNELYGISNKSLEVIFGLDFDYRYNNYVNVPFDQSEIKPYTEPRFLEQIQKDDFVIATVSRLAKKYIKKLIEAAFIISNKYPNQNFCLIVAGDDINSELLIKYKRKYGKKQANLKIIFPGYLHPLGKDFFRQINLFVGMGTAVINSISQRCATITIDPISSKSTGILGINNSNFAYSDSGKQFEIAESIEEFLKNPKLVSKAQKKGFALFTKEFEQNVCMMKLDKLIMTSHFYNCYWDFKHQNNLHNRIRLIIISSLSKLFRLLNK